MSKGITDPDAVLRKMIKARELQSFIVSFGKRHIEQVKTTTDEKTLAHRFWVQYLSVNKMYVNLLDEICTHLSDLLRHIERNRTKCGDLHYSYADYEHWNVELNYYNEMRVQYATWLLDSGKMLDRYNIIFTDNELQTALSIPVKAWNRLYQTGRIPFVVGGCSA